MLKYLAEESKRTVFGDKIRAEADFCVLRGMALQSYHVKHRLRILLGIQFSICILRITIVPWPGYLFSDPLHAPSSITSRSAI